MRCQIVVRTASGFMQWTASEWLAVQLMACVSVDPKTSDELETALRTYRPEHRLMEHAQPLGRLSEPPALVEKPQEQTWCFIDLIGRTIVVSPDFCDVRPKGGCHGWQPDDEDPAGGWYEVSESSPEMQRLAYIHIPPHWKFFRGRSDWQSLVERRYRKAQQEPIVDSYTVLWGAPLWEHLAESVRSASDEKDPRTQMREIHIRWILTPHPLLADCTPQQVLMAGCEYVEADMENRRHYWSRLRTPPQPVPVNSSTYRFGPYCEEHHALHFDYVRTLLEEAWTYRSTMPDAAVSEWVAGLERRASGWWDSPSAVLDSEMSNHEFWDRYRQRVPLVRSRVFSCLATSARAQQLLAECPPFFEHIVWGPTDEEDLPVFSTLYVDIPWFPWQIDFEEDDSGRLRLHAGALKPMLADDFFAEYWNGESPIDDLFGIEPDELSPGDAS
ncbi:MAG: hypothetical protein KatS3mg109_1099 [Pirellulaceae bacterium]|nr:MAG: hypothetical protein KatS3mg109_1099 [Pirellulaceae bacterium]GIW93662.1 MAG: hypothetical protein KatS3mg110_1703 [Pirellulaceae bacterium]